MRNIMTLFLLPLMLFNLDKGLGGGGGGAPPVADPAPETKATEAKEPEPADVAKMTAELEALRKEKADREKAAEQERLARMSEDERKAAEEKALKESLVRQNRELQVSKAGIDPKYVPLIGGSTPEEVESNGRLMAELIAETRAAAVAETRKGMAHTGEPGGTNGEPAPAASPKDIYMEIMKGGK